MFAFICKSQLAVAEFILFAIVVRYGKLDFYSGRVEVSLFFDGSYLH